MLICSEMFSFDALCKIFGRSNIAGSTSVLVQQSKWHPVQLSPGSDCPTEDLK